ncbi:Protein of unknown function DUF58 [Cyclonatronum proteinivorum]|uniref:DUF58 domain-containing protein n=1 Tax=Cyclonatronum proteinivorum TaxID=1457365 RepID=A0A345UKJ8_9BACT|nr:DUF58 domain-containing protein [Cyclonatronum proteinivorum]AXJ01000.1 Protein of unknown function DUF58 [Cyclonatronum proteinivorum]
MASASADILKKVRFLEIKTKGLVNNLFGGEYHSAFKGRGMTFSEVRPYQFGDDIRLIDWNVTARADEPYVKIFEEEREQTLMICADISSSGLFGSQSQRKLDLATELAAVLAFSAIKNNDKVGLLLFAGDVEKFIPPRKGRLHVLRIIRELYTTQPKNPGTSVKRALDYVSRIIPRRSIITLISDMQDTGYETSLKVLNRRHDLICLCVDDHHETELPDAGLIPFLDSETNRYVMVDTSDRNLRHAFEKRRARERQQLRDRLSRMHIDYTMLNTNESYIERLSSLFQQRHRRF